MKNLYKTTILTGVALAFLGGTAFATPDDELDPKELINMSLAQLSNIEVTSVSKKAEKESEAAAAIYVITQDDIRHSGMQSIPELLRVVPGLDVAQSGSHQWAITARGASGQFSNKLLVLIDGRSVYTPLFSGVYWDVQDTPLQDIERIEVIRGPGATLYGANAVNGVINIITKNAKDTQGGLVSVTAGNQENALTTVQYGTKIGNDAYVRLYAKHDEHAQIRNIQNAGADDEWNKQQVGFRADWKVGEAQKFTVQGDIYRGDDDYVFNLPASLTASNPNEKISGGNITAKWGNKLSKTSDTTLQIYYDNAKRDGGLYGNNIQTFDVDLQNIWTAIDGNEITWGAGYRLVESDAIDNPYITFFPAFHSDSLFSAFVQDKITLHPKDVFLTIGSKFEHNDYTGVEVQPSVRLSWLVDSRQTVWSSVSRAVRTPSIGASSAQYTIAQIPSVHGTDPTYLTRLPATTDSEKLVAYELGYRIQPTDKISIDVSTFYNNYSNVVIGSLEAPTGPFTSPILGNPYYLVPLVPNNMGKAHSWGVELSAKWHPTYYTEFSANYTLLQEKYDPAHSVGFSYAGLSPQQQFNIQSTFKLPYDVEFNSALYYVDKLSAVDRSTGAGIPSYFRLDARLAWKALDNLELSIAGQNLFDNSHPEFAGFLYQNSSQVPRTFYGNITWKF
jgi:iron complex outermembrane receptor protein